MNGNVVPVAGLTVSLATAVTVAGGVFYFGDQLGTFRERLDAAVAGLDKIGALVIRINDLETKAAVLDAQTQGLMQAIERLEREDRRIRRDMQRDGQR